MSETGGITEDSFPLIVVVDGEIIRIDSNAEVEIIKNNMVPPTSYDASFDLSENQDESIIAYVAGDKIMIIGEGRMKDYEWHDRSPLNNFSNEITTVEVSEGITTLGAFIFGSKGSWSQFTNIQLPSTLQKIGQGAFYFTRNLNTVQYNGTKVEWIKVEVTNVNTNYSNHYLSNQATIICTDGNIKK